MRPSIPPLAIPSQGHMRLKSFSLLICLLTLSCPALAMGKSIYGLNEYIHVEELDLQVAAKLEAQIRANAGLVAEKLLVGPESAEEAADALADPTTANDDDDGAPKAEKGRKKAG